MSRQNKDMPKKAGQDLRAVNVISQVASFDDFADGGGTDGTLDLDETLPDGAVVLAARIRVLTAFDGTTTATIGETDDADRYNTGTVDVTSAGELDAGVPSGQRAHGAETTVQVTLSESADFGNVTQGVALFEVLYV